MASSAVARTSVSTLLGWLGLLGFARSSGIVLATQNKKGRLSLGAPYRLLVVHSDHDIGRLDDDVHAATSLDAKAIYRLVRDRGGNHMTAADIDHYMGGRCALLHFLDGPLI